MLYMEKSLKKLARMVYLDFSFQQKMALLLTEIEKRNSARNILLLCPLYSSHSRKLLLLTCKYEIVITHEEYALK